MLIVQVCIDDIIFGTTSDGLCKEFAELMSSEFKMSMMGELTSYLDYKSDNPLKALLFANRRISRSYSISSIC